MADGIVGVSIMVEDRNQKLMWSHDKTGLRAIDYKKKSIGFIISNHWREKGVVRE